jgi:protein-S-isoprenylcysteine O-methyltransferase Ste14
MAMSAMTICSYLWITWFAIWLLWAIGTKRTQRRESSPSRLSYALFNVVAFWLMFAGDVPQSWLRVRLFPPMQWTAWLGVAITVAGLAFSIWARAYLGRNWSGVVSVKVGHELIRSGPYRWVRHPIYTGLILAFLGTAVVRHQVRGLIAVVLLYAGFKIKSRIEEQAMTATFGPEYAQYASTTGAIIPRLWG